MADFHYRYDFRFGDRKAGYFEICRLGAEIQQTAKFQIGDETYDYSFYLKLDGENLVAFKKGEGEWKSLESYGGNHFPSSAYPLLLNRVTDRLEYFQINEASGEVEGLTILERSGDTVSEFRNGSLVRSFEMKDGIPVKINWGQATSTKQN